MAVQAVMPVACVMRSHSRTSRSKPSQPDEVPFQAITLTFACASSSAARRISESSNCASAGPDNAISVTLKREKCAVTSGSPETIAVVTGSKTVLEDGVSIPRKTRSVIDRLALGSSELARADSPAPEDGIPFAPTPLRQAGPFGPALCRLRPYAIRQKKWQSGAALGGSKVKRELSMDRRTFLKTTAGAGALVTTGGLFTPAISQNAAAKTLRFVPQANLANFDPIWTTQYVVRNASAAVWDTLYGFDETLT